MGNLLPTPTLPYCPVVVCPSSPVSFISHLNASAASPYAQNTRVILFAVLF